jgi:hypothetical protein
VIARDRKTKTSPLINADDTDGRSGHRVIGKANPLPQIMQKGADQQKQKPPRRRRDAKNSRDRERRLDGASLLQKPNLRARHLLQPIIGKILGLPFFNGLQNDIGHKFRRIT